MPAKKKAREHRLLRALNLYGLDHLDAVLLAALADAQPLLLIGAHGTARSALLNRIAAALRLVHRHYNASLISFDDLLARLDIPRLVRETYLSAGYGPDAAGVEWKPFPEKLAVLTNLCIGAFEDGERELRHLSDDQAICIGYANSLEETRHLPPAHWLARQIGRHLFDLRVEKGAGQAGPDGKVIVRVETHGTAWTPVHVSISLNHHEGSDWLLLRELAEEAVALGCAGRPVPRVELNGAGMFVAGGPTGDNGLSGKKLVVDAYGPTVPIGGGAWSGKDLRKVDRLGGLLARRCARLAVHRGLGAEARVTLEYTPGCDRPAGVGLLVDGRPFAGNPVRALGDPVMENASTWSRFVTTDLALPRLARWGHQADGAPWERTSG